MSSFSIKLLYVLCKPAASVRARYKLSIYVKKSQRIFLSLDMVSLRFYNETAGKHEA